jgi:signal transduction histidine kinase
MRRRFLASTIGITIVAVAILGGPLAYVVDRVAQEETTARLERQAAAIGLAVEPDVDEGRLPAVEDLARLLPEGDHAVLRADDAAVEAGQALDDAAHAVTIDIRPGVTLELATSAQPTEVRVQRAVLLILVIATVGILAAAVLAVVQSRRLVRPLEQLALASRRLGAGDFSAPMPRSGLPEIDDVADALDASSARVATMLSAEREFSSHAGHQLRSALSGLSLHIESLTTHGDAEVRQEADDALAQVGRLADTIDELLRLARTGEAGERRTVDAVALVRQHVEDHRAQFARVQRHLTLASPPSALALVTPGALGQAIDVLLSNALEHGGGVAHVIVGTTPGGVEITVYDEGPGIAPEARPRLFARRATADSHGVGLPLARLLVESDGGRLDLVDPDKATFLIRVPHGDSS